MPAPKAPPRKTPHSTLRVLPTKPPRASCLKGCLRGPEAAGCLSRWPWVTPVCFQGPFVRRREWHGWLRPWAAFGAVVWAPAQRSRRAAGNREQARRPGLGGAVQEAQRPPGRDAGLRGGAAGEARAPAAAERGRVEGRGRAARMTPSRAGWALGRGRRRSEVTRWPRESRGVRRT